MAKRIIATEWGGLPRAVMGASGSSSLRGRLAHGAFWSLTGAIASRGLGLLSAMVVGRWLGKEGFGELGVIQNTVGMFGTLAGFGMGLTANKFVAEFRTTDPMRAGRIIGLTSTIAWLGSAGMSLVLAAVAPLLAAKALAAPHLSGVLQSASLLLLFSGVNGAQLGVLSGFEAFRATARINLLSGLISFPLMLTSAWALGLAGVVWALIGTQAISCWLCSTAIKRSAMEKGVRISYRGVSENRRMLLHFSLPAVLSGIVNASVTWIAAALVVNQLDGYGDMGIYNAALRVKMLPEMLLSILVAPILPVLSEAYGKKDLSTFQRALSFNFLMATLIMIPFALIQGAAPWLTLLPFGFDYQGRDIIVQLLMLHAVCFALLYPMANVLVSMGEMWFSWGVGLLHSIIYILLAMALVPSLKAAGLAAALSCAFILANIPCVVFLQRRHPCVLKSLRFFSTSALTGILFTLCAAFSMLHSRLCGMAAGLLAAGVFILWETWVFRGRCRRLVSEQSPTPL